MSAVFGIHFGSTSSCISVIKDGSPQVLTNDIGERITPCIVAYNEGDIGVGLPARQNMIRNLHNTVVNVKQLLGCCYDDVSQYIQENDVKVVGVKDQPMIVMRGEGGSNKQFSPTTIATFVFKKLMDTAKSYIVQNSYNAVLSAPTHFTPSQRTSITLAAEQAGFKVMRLTNHSSSSALAYHLLSDPLQPPCTVMVLRVGGTSSDVSLLRVASGMCSTLRYLKDDKLGGFVIDNLIVNLLVSEFKRKTKMDCRENKRSMFKLLQAAEEVKKILSNACTSTSSCHVESLFEGVDFSHPLSRLRLEGLSGPFVNSVVDLCKKILGDDGVVDKIIMVGGVANTPCLVRKVQATFASTTLLTNIPPDQAIAIGNAIQALILSSSRQETSLKSVTIPCLSKHVFIQTSDDQQLLFPRGTVVPFKKQVHFKLPNPQKTVLLKLFQGDLQRMGKDVNLGGEGEGVEMEAMVNGDTGLSPLLSVALPHIDHSNTIDAIFHFRHDGSLHLTCSSGEHKEDVIVEASNKTVSLDALVITS